MNHQIMIRTGLILTKIIIFYTPEISFADFEVTIES